MFTVYLDDSGTDPKQAVAIATALIIPAARIAALESEWKSFSEKEGFSWFHTSEFVAKNHKSEFANWDDAKLERVFKRVTQICRKYGTKGISFAVRKTDYDEVVPNDWRAHFGRYHYTWAIRHVMHLLDEWRLPKTTVPPLEYIFSWMGGESDPRRKEIQTVMEQAESIAIDAKRGGDYANYGFRRSRDIAGLQCVDAMSWVCYRVSLRNFQLKPLHPLAVGPEKEFCKQSWLDILMVSREDLQDWISKEMKHPRAIAYFAKYATDGKSA